MPGIEPRLPRRQLVADNFNRADANPIGSPWITEGGGGLQIISNVLRGVTLNGENAARYGSINPLVDQWAEFTLAVSLSSDSLGAQVRMQAGANSGYTYEIGAAGTQADIYRVSAGTYTSLINIALTTTAGDRERLEVRGTTLQAFHNDTLVATVEDTTWASGWPGMHIFSNTTAAQGDNFYAGDFEYIFQPPNPPAVGRPVAGY